MYLPLRSNAGWFSTADTHALLASRLKNLLLFHDFLALEDGRYIATFVERGSSDHWIPGEQIKDRREITYRRIGSGFHVNIAPDGSKDVQALISGNIEASYEADFWPTVAEAGLLSADYINWVNYDLTSLGKQKVQHAVFCARQDPEIESGLPQNSFLRRKIVDSLHTDAAIASSLSLPMSVDIHAASVISRSSERNAGLWGPDSRSSLESAWLNLGLPDAGRETWDVVIAARESAAGAELRHLMQRLGDLATQRLTGCIDQNAWDEESRKLLVGELVGELLKRKAHVPGAAINFGLNFIPYLGVALSSAKDAWKLVSERRSWISLLDGLR